MLVRTNKKSIYYVLDRRGVVDLERLIFFNPDLVQDFSERYLDLTPLHPPLHSHLSPRLSPQIRTIFPKTIYPTTSPLSPRFTPFLPVVLRDHCSGHSGHAPTHFFTHFSAHLPPLEGGLLFPIQKSPAYASPLTHIHRVIFLCHRSLCSVVPPGNEIYIFRIAFIRYLEANLVNVIKIHNITIIEFIYS